MRAAGQPAPAEDGPTATEVGEALLDAARYGDLEDLEQLLKDFGSSHLGYSNQAGVTALHQACANGHAECVSWLIEHGAAFTVNESGNTPLHWAVQNQHLGAVKALLSGVENVDVLVRNGFGKSALTEAFSGKDAEMLGALLEHPSASEEKLLEGTEVDGDHVGQGVHKEGAALPRHEIVHRLVLDPLHRERLLQIRELEIVHANEPFGRGAEEDSTGLGLWSASLVLARWLTDNKDRLGLRGAHVVELGAGCGLPGLAAAVHAQPRRVTLTDLNPAALKNLSYNVELSREGWEACSEVEVARLDWGDEAHPLLQQQVDVALGSDLVYERAVGQLLGRAVGRMLRPGGSLLYVAPSTGRDGLAQFLTAGLPEQGLQMVGRTEAPRHYSRDSPLEDGGQEEFLLHFNELATGDKTFFIYHFVKDPTSARSSGRE